MCLVHPLRIYPPRIYIRLLSPDHTVVICFQHIVMHVCLAYPPHMSPPTHFPRHVFTIDSSLQALQHKQIPPHILHVSVSYILYIFSRHIFMFGSAVKATQ